MRHLALLLSDAPRRVVATTAVVAMLVLLSATVGASHDDGTGPRSLGGALLPREAATLVRVEAEDFTTRTEGAAVDDPDATGGRAWKLTEYGNISVSVDVPETGIVWLKVRARGEHPPNLMTTHMHPVVDGEQRGEWDVGPRWTTYLQSMPLAKGRHAVAVDNFNNYHAPALDRTLVVDWIELSVPFLDGASRAGASGEAFVDGPDVQEAGTGMARRDDEGARGRTSWQMWGIGCFVELVVVDDPGSYRLRARLRGNEPGGVGSRTTVLVDDAVVLRTFAGAAWNDTEARVELGAGPHIVDVCYDNDYGGDEKRNLWLDELHLVPDGVTAAMPSPTPSSPTPASPTAPAAVPTTATLTPPASPTVAVKPTPTPSPSPEQESRDGTPVPVAIALLALGLAALGHDACRMKKR